MIRFVIITLLAGLAHATLGQSHLNEAIKFYNEGKAAYNEGNFGTYLRKVQQAHGLLPYSRSVKYNLAAAYAVNGRSAESLQVIAELIRVDNRMEFNADSVFYELKGKPRYYELTQQAEDLSDPISKSELAFQIPEIDLHPESVAYDVNENVFYISSMRKRKIVRYDPETEETTDWVTTADLHDLYGVMGIKISNDGKYLWFCSAPLPQIEGYEENGRYTPSVFRLALEDPTDVERFALPAESIPGDLVISPEGEVYVSDSALPRIFTISDGHARLFFDGDRQLVNLQGLTLAGDNLFIADYLLGVHRLDIAEKKLTPLKIASPDNMAGVDGLYYYKGSLLAIQNGVYPFRVGRYYLEGDQVTRFEYFDRASDYLDEPTLGVVVGNQLYFVANSPWGYYDGNELQVPYLRTPQIRRITLD